MKTKTEYQIRCSGRGKPWHGTRREHVYKVSTEEKGLAAAERWEDEVRTPLGEECLPMIPEQRQVGAWSPIESGTQDELGGTK